MEEEENKKEEEENERYLNRWAWEDRKLYPWLRRPAKRRNLVLESPAGRDDYSNGTSPETEAWGLPRLCLDSFPRITTIRKYMEGQMKSIYKTSLGIDVTFRDEYRAK